MKDLKRNGTLCGKNFCKVDLDFLHWNIGKFMNNDVSII